MNLLKKIFNDFKIGLLTVKAIQIKFNKTKQSNFWVNLGYYLWGCDIFIGEIPMIKLMIICNIIVWILLFIFK